MAEKFNPQNPIEIENFINSIADDVFQKISMASGDNLDVIQTMLWQVAEVMIHAAALTALEQGGPEQMDAKVESMKDRIDQQIQLFKKP